MTVEKNMQGTIAELKLTGWLDTQSAPLLEEELKSLDESVTGLVLDCAGLEYVSSAGLRQIVAAHKQMNGSLTLRNVSGEIMAIIRLTGIDKRLNFE